MASALGGSSKQQGIEDISSYLAGIQKRLVKQVDHLVGQVIDEIQLNIEDRVAEQLTVFNVSADLRLDAPLWAGVLPATASHPGLVKHEAPKAFTPALLPIGTREEEGCLQREETPINNDKKDPIVKVKWEVALSDIAESSDAMDSQQSPPPSPRRCRANVRETAVSTKSESSSLGKVSRSPRQSILTEVTDIVNDIRGRVNNHRMTRYLFGHTPTESAKNAIVRPWRKVFGHTSTTNTSDTTYRSHQAATDGGGGMMQHSGCARLVRSEEFETFYSLMILLNCIYLGVQANGQVNDSYSKSLKTALDVCEHAFFSVFFVELVLRFCVYGCRSYNPRYQANWLNLLDVFLVLVTGMIFSYLLPLIAYIWGLETDRGVLQLMSVLRALKLLRLVRLLQRSPLLHEAWMLVRGLSDSLKTLFWTCIVIFFITYFFAVFGLVIVSKQLKQKRDSTVDPIEYKEIDSILGWMGGLDVLMGTLIQLLTTDSWNALLVQVKKYVSYAWLYFYSYIALAVFVLMNLVTAVIVDNAVKHGRADLELKLKEKERERVKDLREMELLFMMMDADGNGTVSWEEFKAAFADPEMARKWKMMDYEPEECRDLFKLLDSGDGEIETQEFFDGLRRMKGAAAAKDVFRLLKNVEDVHAVITTLQDSVDKMLPLLVDRRASIHGSLPGSPCSGRSSVRTSLNCSSPQSPISQGVLWSSCDSGRMHYSRSDSKGTNETRGSRNSRSRKGPTPRALRKVMLQSRSNSHSFISSPGKLGPSEDWDSFDQGQSQEIAISPSDGWKPEISSQSNSSFVRISHLEEDRYQTMPFAQLSSAGTMETVSSSNEGRNVMGI